MTREEATRWFWRTCPPGRVLDFIVVPDARGPSVYGWVSADGLLTLSASEFLFRCRDLTGEDFAGSFDNDSDLIEYVRGVFLAAYGRIDACGIRVIR